MLQSFVLTIVAVAVLVIFMRSTGDRAFYTTGRNIFNPLSYNFAIYLVTGFLGSVAIAIAPSDLPINTMVDMQSSTVRVAALFVMLYGVLIFLAATRFIKTILHYDALQAQAEVKPLAKSIAIVVAAVLLLAIIYYLYPRLNLFVQVLFGGLDTWGVLALRANLEESEIEGFFVRRLIVEGIGWIFVLYLVQIGRYKILFCVLCFAISLYFLASLAKIKVVLFILSILMVNSWGLRIGLAKIAKYSFVFFMGLIGIWAIFVGNINPDYLFSIYSEGLIGRIIISEISALYPHLSIFGGSENHLGITSLSNMISSVFGETVSPRSGRLVLEIISPDWVAAGIGGVYNTVFFGEAFANFGYVGLFLSPIWVVSYYGILIWLSKFLSQPLKVAFLVHAALNASVMAGFNDFLWNPFLVVVFAILLIVSRGKSLLRYGLKSNV